MHPLGAKMSMAALPTGQETLKHMHQNGLKKRTGGG